MLSLEGASKQKRYLHRRSARTLKQNARNTANSAAPIKSNSEARRTKVRQCHIFRIWKYVCRVPLHAQEIFSVFFTFPARGSSPILCVCDKTGNRVLGEWACPDGIVLVQRVAPFPASQAISRSQVFAVRQPCRRAGHQLPEGHHALTRNQGYSLTGNNNP